MVHAVLAITLRVNQTVSGLSLVIVGSGLSAYVGAAGDAPMLEAPNGVDVSPLLPGALRDLPAIGPILLGHDAVRVRRRSRSSPRPRTSCTAPRPACRSAPSVRTRRQPTRRAFPWCGSATSPQRSGASGRVSGGAYLVLAVLGTWQTGMTAGAGWIAVALVILAGWRPVARPDRGLPVRCAAWVGLHPADRAGRRRVRLPDDDPVHRGLHRVVLVSASPTRARKVAAPAALAIPVPPRRTLTEPGFPRQRQHRRRRVRRGQQLGGQRWIRSRGARSFQVSGAAYDAFMGRYSAPLALCFADAAGVTAGQMALDVGCGPGALASVLVERLGTGAVAACDPSPPFVAECAARHPGLDVRSGRAEALPFDDGTFDHALAQLVLHFVSDPEQAAAEMCRVVRSGGTVSACVWDFVEEMEMLRRFWDAALAVRPEAPDQARTMRFGTAGELVELFAASVWRTSWESTLTVTSTYAHFDELWAGFLAGIGPAGTFCVSLPDDEREQVRREMFVRMSSPSGPVTLAAVARCVTGRVE